MSHNDPYASPSSSQPQTQQVSTSTMLWGESDEKYDNDHKSAGCCACSASVSNIFYGLILVAGTIAAYAAKFISQKTHISWWKFCPEDGGGSDFVRDLCVQNQTVYRISAVLATFFLIMAIVTFFNRKFHYESWFFKGSIISILFSASFFIPGHFFAVYREIARWTSFLFIVMQVLVLVDFAHSLHENIVRHMDDDENSSTGMKARALYLVIAISSILSFIIGIILLFVYYNPCSLHATVISLTLIAGVLVTGLSLVGSIGKGLLPPALLSMYCTLIIYQALTTNTTQSCSAIGVTKQMPVWLVVLSFVASLLQIGWMAVRAGQNNRMFIDSSIKSYSSPLSSQDSSSRDPYSTNSDDQESGGNVNRKNQYKSMDNGESDEEVNPPKHWIFHFTLFTASAYVAMILTGWGQEVATSINNPEASIQSFWIKVISVAASFLLYFWTLIAPIIFPDRDFS